MHLTPTTHISNWFYEFALWRFFIGLLGAFAITVCLNARSVPTPVDQRCFDRDGIFQPDFGDDDLDCANQLFLNSHK